MDFCIFEKNRKLLSLKQIIRPTNTQEQLFADLLENMFLKKIEIFKICVLKKIEIFSGKLLRWCLFLIKKRLY